MRRPPRGAAGQRARQSTGQLYQRVVGAQPPRLRPAGGSICLPDPHATTAEGSGGNRGVRWARFAQLPTNPSEDRIRIRVTIVDGRRELQMALSDGSLRGRRLGTRASQTASLASTCGEHARARGDRKRCEDQEQSNASGAGTRAVAAARAANRVRFVGWQRDERQRWGHRMEAGGVGGHTAPTYGLAPRSTQDHANHRATHAYACGTSLWHARRRLRAGLSLVQLSGLAAPYGR